MNSVHKKSSIMRQIMKTVVMSSNKIVGAERKWSIFDLYFSWCAAVTDVDTLLSLKDIYWPFCLQLSCRLVLKVSAAVHQSQQQLDEEMLCLWDVWVDLNWYKLGSLLPSLLHFLLSKHFLYDWRAWRNHSHLVWSTHTLIFCVLQFFDL